jgi:DNA-directed RNA polymerase specialized sigma24 family protein
METRGMVPLTHLMEVVMDRKELMVEAYQFAQEYIGRIVKKQFSSAGEEVVSRWVVRCLEKGYFDSFDSTKSSLKTWVITGLRSEFSNLRRSTSAFNKHHQVAPVMDRIADEKSDHEVDEGRVIDIISNITDVKFRGASVVLKNEDGENEEFLPTYRSILRLMAMGYAVTQVASFFKVSVPLVRQKLVSIRSEVRERNLGIA